MVQGGSAEVNDLAGLVGQYVKVMGRHPHAGEYGTAERLEEIVGVGKALRVHLEHCPHLTESCFVFSRRHVRPATWRERGNA